MKDAIRVILEDLLDLQDMVDDSDLEDDDKAALYDAIDDAMNLEGCLRLL